MIFPFTIKYSVQLSDNFPSNSNKETLEFIKEYIIKRKGDNIVIENNRLTFKSKTSSKWDILSTIDKGIFNIQNNEGKIILTYEFFMYQLFIMVTIMSIMMMVVAQDIWFAKVGFLWLGGMNWLVTIIRHKSMLTDIKKAIEHVNKLKE
jgi:hypothetical protein